MIIFRTYMNGYNHFKIRGYFIYSNYKFNAAHHISLNLCALYQHQNVQGYD